MLEDVGQKISTIPEGFTPHRQIKKVYDKRAGMVSSPESLVDWGMAEALAYGTLVAEGNHVRLSGQVRAADGCITFVIWSAITLVRSAAAQTSTAPRSALCNVATQPRGCTNLRSAEMQLGDAHTLLHCFRTLPLCHVCSRTTSGTRHPP